MTPLLLLKLLVLRGRLRLVSEGLSVDRLVHRRGVTQAAFILIAFDRAADWLVAVPPR